MKTPPVTFIANVCFYILYNSTKQNASSIFKNVLKEKTFLGRKGKVLGKL